jgi:hypothetical protein
MRTLHFNEQFLVLLGPIITSFFACSNEEKNQPKEQTVRALVLLSLWFESSYCCLHLGRDIDAKKFKTICNIVINLNIYFLPNKNV